MSFVGRTIDRYAVEAELDSGGFGTVYRARHTVTGRRVALKLLHAEREGALDVVERFLREARVLSAISSPHVVQVLDAGITDERKLFLAMELLEGEPLSKRIERSAPLSVDEAIGITRQVLAGLAAAHAAGVVHRDLKPANVFLARSPRGGEVAKVLDFGISKSRSRGDESVLTVTGAVLGTPAYMAPEQLHGSRDVDGRADIFAATVCLYEMLSDRLPYRAKTLQGLITQRLSEPPTPLSDVAPHLPRALFPIVDRGLARDPDARFRTPAELDDALRTVSLGALPATYTAPSSIHPSPPPGAASAAPATATPLPAATATPLPGGGAAATAPLTAPTPAPASFPLAMMTAPTAAPAPASFPPASDALPTPTPLSMPTPAAGAAPAPRPTPPELAPLVSTPLPAAISARDDGGRQHGPGPALFALLGGALVVIVLLVAAVVTTTALWLGSQPPATVATPAGPPTPVTAPMPVAAPPPVAAPGASEPLVPVASAPALPPPPISVAAPEPAAPVAAPSPAPGPTGSSVGAELDDVVGNVDRDAIDALLARAASGIARCDRGRAETVRAQVFVHLDGAIPLAGPHALDPGDEATAACVGRAIRAAGPFDDRESHGILHVSVRFGR